MRQVHTLAVEESRQRVLETKSAHVKQFPSDTGMARKMKYATKVPELAALGIFYEKVAPTRNLVQGNTNTKFNHRQCSLTLLAASWFWNHVGPLAPRGTPRSHEYNLWFMGG